MVNPARTSASRRLAVLASALIVVFGSAFALTAQAPAKKVLTVDDYTKWRNISGSEISGDGNWVAYGVAQSNTLPAEAKPVLHLLKLDTSTGRRGRRRDRTARSRPTRSGSRIRSIPRADAAAEAGAAAAVAAARRPPRLRP